LGAHDQWPRTVVSGGVTNTIYQPQVESWDGKTLAARSAVAVQSASQPQPVYGVVNLSAATLVNNTDRTVRLENIQVVNGDFPSAPAKAQEYVNALKETLPKQTFTFSQDTLEAALAANEQQLKATAEPLNNTPPRIFFSTVPAVLVLIDGPPAYRPVPGTELDRVLNTRVLLVKDRQPRPVYFLHVLDGYMQALSLDGPWAPSPPPPGAADLEKEARQATIPVDLLEGQPDDTGAKPSLVQSAPEVFVSTTPAELVSFQGQPDFVPIPGTKLLYVRNTTGNVFKLLNDQQTYVLLSGRWFKAPNLNGPWEYVAGSQLPADFAQIPDNSPKENVKASVPGTQQAREALIANSIPQSSAVPRSNQMQDPQIDGAPQMAPIPGTPLHYVANSGTPIIQVDAQSWYACQNGVWYVATSVNGPWTVAASVPAVIYSIPTSSPMHYVTYVRVYNANSDYVQTGYTPGYLGTVVSSDYVVVYGTGYYYRPWVGSYWYSGPATWGFGWDPFWAPWSGWSFGFGFGWYAGYYGPYWPSWGPYRYWHHHHHYPYWGPGGWGHTAVNVYRRESPRAPAFTTPITATRPTATRNVFGRAYNSRTGNLVAGDTAPVQNVFRAARTTQAPGRTVNRGTTFVAPDGRVYTRDSARPGWRTPASATRPAESAGQSRDSGRSSDERRSEASQRSEPRSSPPPPPPSSRMGDGDRGGWRSPAGSGRGSRR
jgi:hypothetical protein